MVAKREQSKDQGTYELLLTHADIINMMNDPQVQLSGNTVSATQVLEIASRKQNGSEVVIQKFEPNDTLVMRFRSCAVDDQTTPLNGVDIT
jgi:hypothetical protein